MGFKLSKITKQINSTLGSAPYLATLGGAFLVPNTKTIKTIGKAVRSGVHTVGSSLGGIIGQARAIQPGVAQIAGQVAELQGLASNPLQPASEQSFAPAVGGFGGGGGGGGGGDKTLLYVGVGVGVVLVVMLMMNRK